MSSRSRPLWPLLTATLIGLPVLYVLSFGPACWIRSRLSGVWAERTFGAVYYRPIGLAIVNGPPFVAKPMRWYCELGMDPGAMLVFCVSPSVTALFGYEDPAP
jgi:hypothetical protein